MSTLPERLRTGAKYHDSEGDLGLACIMRQSAEAIDQLANALAAYMSQFGQALEANNIPYGPAQEAADAKARAALNLAREQSR